MTDLLEAKGLTKYFGGLAAVDGLDLEVRKGEILGLIGPNGAGKTTVFNVICGVLSPTDGKIIFRGEDITGLKSHRIAQKGIIRTFQLMTLWSDLTVMDTMRLSFHRISGVRFFEALLDTASARRKEKQVDERAMEVLAFVGMDHLKDQIAGTLSHGYQRTLSLAIAVAARPQMLMLDEPVTALSPERTNSILELIKRLRKEGSTVLVIEHNMRAIFSICDRIAVINYGNKIAEGVPDEIKDDPVVISAYLGVGKGVA